MRNLPVYQKIIIVFAILVVPITVTTIAVNVNVVAYLKSSIMESTRNKVNYSRDQLNNQITFIRNQHYVFMRDANMEELNFRAEDLSTYEELTLLNRLTDAMLSIRDSSELINDMAVYIEPLDRLVSLSDGIGRMEKASKWGQLRRMAIERQRSFYTYGDQMFFSETANNATITVFIEINQHKLIQFLSGMVSDEGGNGFFLADNSFQAVIASSRRPEIETGIAEHVSAQAIGRDQQDSFRLTNGDDSYLVIYNRVNALGSTLFTYIDEKEVTRVISRYSWIIGALTAASLLLIILFALSVNRMIHKPLNQLIRAFRKIETDPQLLTASTSVPNNEFKYLNDSFENMRNEWRASIQLNFEQKLLLQQSELRQLQSQINPHFLYNGFYNIYRMCKAEDSSGAGELSLKLAAYYEFITRSGHDELPFTQEYEHAKVYCDIQSIRFARYVSIEIGALPEGSGTISVPRLIVQPIVENVFKHAFKRERQPETCSIKAVQEAGRLTVTVEDSGKDLSDSMIEDLNRRLRRPAAITEKTGLVNVSYRLQLHYGDSGCLSASRSELGGLRIALSLPMQ
ncbi:histidine kinase [Paenibacillus sp. J5C_2022]|uniref:sensor histidine kinase n=1 Tax=Paenibacillus sp. J5C2022 TaxID=2977129 RepID=UPI0021CE5F9C|nr:histidine kinase [Paenibacillus sp. J5C2022]MCU6712632.1 histidine kinase [Paenibacillus sp. J5C2022]